MSFIADPFLHTKRFNTLQDSDIYDDEIVILSSFSTEERGSLPVWNKIKTTNPNKLLLISELPEQRISLISKGSTLELSLRDEPGIINLVSQEKILFDITGLSHNVWAPLLKILFEANKKIRVLYAEPKEYAPHPTPASSTLFDLTVSFGGLGPLPGFAKLSGPTDDSKCLFIATLGFEGNRPKRLVAQIDPVPKVIPIVGVPGFQLEFPAFTVISNKSLFKEYQAHSELRYTRASCPFGVIEELEKLRKDYPDHYMYIAPVGTKPHSLGAILYSIMNPSHTEIMFDYPVKKNDRTKGVGTIHIYDVGALNV